MESMDFSAEIDEAALASLLLSKSVEHRYLIWWRYRTLYKQSLTGRVKITSNYGFLLHMLSKYGDDLVKVLSGEQNGEFKKVILPGLCGDSIRDLYDAIERQDFPT
ncbi:hypothetical protein V7S43_018237 [Phytophthora oleae]|uniref:Uncharacterized protein n=1 Tax=Phytophthora oleae TaxID=2107226 RepID=A0ABD3ERF3_9STRA